jgi:hypothetical protein
MYHLPHKQKERKAATLVFGKREAATTTTNEMSGAAHIENVLRTKTCGTKTTRSEEI